MPAAERACAQVVARVPPATTKLTQEWFLAESNAVCHPMVPHVYFLARMIQRDILMRNDGKSKWSEQIHVFMERGEGAVAKEPTHDNQKYKEPAESEQFKGACLSMSDVVR